MTYKSDYLQTLTFFSCLLIDTSAKFNLSGVINSMQMLPKAFYKRRILEISDSVFSDHYLEIYVS
jgi:hypothetical protein